MHSNRTVAYSSTAVCLSIRHAATNAANILNADVTVSKIAACCISIIGMMLIIMPHVRTICVYIVGDMGSMSAGELTGTGGKSTQDGCACLQVCVALLVGM